MTEEMKEEIQRAQPIVDYDILKIAIERLKDILEREVILLKNENFDELMSFQDEKKDIIHFLEVQQNIVNKNPDFASTFDEEQKEVLKDLAQSLLEISEINMKEITKARYINEKVIEIISQSVSEEKEKFSVYNQMGSKGKTRYTTATPYVALNNKV